MYDLLFIETAEVLRVFLYSAFSPLPENWWNEYVWNALSPDQRKKAKEHRAKDLHGLDLLGLLNVLDRNWSKISNKKPLPPEARNSLKEIQSIRNRWANPSKSPSKTDILRALDTLARLLKFIEADPGLLAKVLKRKEEEQRTEKEHNKK